LGKGGADRVLKVQNYFDEKHKGPLAEFSEKRPQELAEQLFKMLTDINPEEAELVAVRERLSALIPLKDKSSKGLEDLNKANKEVFELMRKYKFTAKLVKTGGDDEEVGKYEREKASGENVEIPH
jgi:Rad3-related DNA helicase